MPAYDYECECGKVREVIRRMDAPDPACECGKATMRQVFLVPPMIDSAFIGSTKCPGYQCVVTDQWIDTSKKRREMIAETGCIPKG